MSELRLFTICSTSLSNGAATTRCGRSSFRTSRDGCSTRASAPAGIARSIRRRRLSRGSIPAQLCWHGRAGRCPTLSAGGRLYRMDVTALEFPAASFDAAVATFLFCVLPESQQVPALRELDRVVRPGGLIRLLEYVRPRGTLRRMVSRLWDPWIAWAYGASFDRQTERHVPAAPALKSSRAVTSSMTS